VHVIVWSIIANPLLSKFNAAPCLLLFKKEEEGREREREREGEGEREVKTLKDGSQKF